MSGTWDREEFIDDNGIECVCFRCANCGVSQFYPSKHCPNCGAYMKETTERRPCVWCWYARDRTDVAGVYCTKGFENPDGTCTRFKSYEEMRDKDE